MLKLISSAMFIKSVIAIVVTAGFAWGVVYYGTDSMLVANNAEPANNLETTKTSVPTNTEVEAQNIREVTKPIPEPISGQSSDPEQIMPILMLQAEKIDTIEIKDQAYLNVVSFSVNQRQYNFADATLQKISQPELRDTARSQIAIALAMDGRAVEAFDVIDTVEIDALRDVMRLQVIEAVIVRGTLPAGLIRK
jgi:hypothetical protein